MVSASELVRRYETAYPGTGIPDAQKQERAERILFKAERVSHRRTGRSRGIIVPDLPWQAKGA